MHLSDIIVGGVIPADSLIFGGIFAVILLFVCIAGAIACQDC